VTTKNAAQTSNVRLIFKESSKRQQKILWRGRANQSGCLPCHAMSCHVVPCRALEDILPCGTIRKSCAKASLV
jgi:hypothetical protein